MSTNTCISIVNQASESKAGDCTATLSVCAVYGRVGKAVKIFFFFFLLVTQWKSDHSLPTEVAVRSVWLEYNGGVRRTAKSWSYVKSSEYILYTLCITGNNFKLSQFSLLKHILSRIAFRKRFCAAIFPKFIFSCVTLKKLSKLASPGIASFV